MSGRSSGSIIRVDASTAEEEEEAENGRQRRHHSTPVASPTESYIEVVDDSDEDDKIDEKKTAANGGGSGGDDGLSSSSASQKKKSTKFPGGDTGGEESLEAAGLNYDMRRENKRGTFHSSSSDSDSEASCTSGNGSEQREMRKRSGGRKRKRNATPSSTGNSRSKKAKKQQPLDKCSTEVEEDKELLLKKSAQEEVREDKTSLPPLLKCVFSPASGSEESGERLRAAAATTRTENSNRKGATCKTLPPLLKVVDIADKMEVEVELGEEGEKEEDRVVTRSVMVDSSCHMDSMELIPGDEDPNKEHHHQLPPPHGHHHRRRRQRARFELKLQHEGQHHLTIDNIVERTLTNLRQQFLSSDVGQNSAVKVL